MYNLCIIIHMNLILGSSKFNSLILDNNILNLQVEIETVTQETIKVEGMSCMHCQMRVKKAVEAVEGVQSADVNLQTKQVTVDFEEGKKNLEKVKDAVREAGYEPI